jgi:hypothetical protein
MSEAERTPEALIDPLVRGYLRDQAETVDARAIRIGVLSRLRPTRPEPAAGCSSVSRLAGRLLGSLRGVLKRVARGVSRVLACFQRHRPATSRTSPRSEGG